MTKLKTDSANQILDKVVDYMVLTYGDSLTESDIKHSIAESIHQHEMAINVLTNLGDKKVVLRIKAFKYYIKYFRYELHHRLNRENP